MLTPTMVNLIDVIKDVPLRERGKSAIDVKEAQIDIYYPYMLSYWTWKESSSAKLYTMSMYVHKRNNSQ